MRCIEYFVRLMEGKQYVPFRRLSYQPPGTPVLLQTPSILAVIRDQRGSKPEECKLYIDGERSGGSGASLGGSLEYSLNIISVPDEVAGPPRNTYLPKSPPVGVRDSSQISSSRLRPRP